MTASVIPIRLPGNALHLGEPTGAGYRTKCGRRLAGEELEVPMPRFPRSRRHVEAYWVKCWSHEVVCRSCDKIANAAQPPDLGVTTSRRPPEVSGTLCVTRSRFHLGG